MTSSANVVTGFEFPHAEIPRGPRETLTAETSLPVTIFASPRNFKSSKTIIRRIVSPRPRPLRLRQRRRPRPRRFAQQIQERLPSPVKTLLLPMHDPDRPV